MTVPIWCLGCKYLDLNGKKPDREIDFDSSSIRPIATGAEPSPDDLRAMAAPFLRHRRALLYLVMRAETGLSPQVRDLTVQSVEADIHATIKARFSLQCRKAALSPKRKRQRCILLAQALSSRYTLSAAPHNFGDRPWGAQREHWSERLLGLALIDQIDQPKSCQQMKTGFSTFE